MMEHVLDFLENVEALCQLFNTVEKQLEENPKSCMVNDSYFARLKALSSSPHLASRMRFMVLDVLDLQAKKWIPRREAVRAKTISEIHTEAEQKLGLRPGTTSMRNGHGAPGVTAIEKIAGKGSCFHLDCPKCNAKVTRWQCKVAASRQCRFYFRKKLQHLIAEEHCAPIIVRLGWHGDGTYDFRTKMGGPFRTIRHTDELAHEANKGLDISIRLLKPIREQFPVLSYVDFYQLEFDFGTMAWVQFAHVVAIEISGGPTIPFHPGREDKHEPPEEGHLLDATKGTRVQYPGAVEYCPIVPSTANTRTCILNTGTIPESKSPVIDANPATLLPINCSHPLWQLGYFVATGNFVATLPLAQLSSQF
eukprot:Gb_35770 [translate_table: standard]